MTDVVAPIHGRRLDARYTLLEKLGAGGQGEVWRAHDETRGVDVALKVLTPAVARAEGMWAAFEHEYAIASRLDHASVLKVFPPQRSGEVVVLPMELATGGDLRRLRGAGYLEIIPVLLDIAQALEHAHERGVIHRDLKPGNVLFDARGRVRLADFGAAGTTTTSAADARMQGLSPFTASPEQLRGEPPTPGDDIYGLGALAYELLSGYPPYYPHFDIKRAQQEPVPNLVPTRQIPPLLSALVMRMLQKSPRERPRSMREVIDELDGALNDTLTFDFETVEDPARPRSSRGETNTAAAAAPVFPPPVQPRTAAIREAMLAGKTVALSAAYTSDADDKVLAASARTSGTGAGGAVAAASVDPPRAPREWPSAQIRAAAASVAELREAESRALIERVERAGESQQLAKDNRSAPTPRTPPASQAAQPARAAVPVRVVSQGQTPAASQTSARRQPPAAQPNGSSQPQTWSPSQSPSPAADEPQMWPQAELTAQPPASRRPQGGPPGQAPRSAESHVWLHSEEATQPVRSNPQARAESRGSMQRPGSGEPQSWQQTEMSAQPRAQIQPHAAVQSPPPRPVVLQPQMQHAPFATAGFAAGSTAPSISSDRPLWEDLKLEAVPRVNRLEPIKKRRWPIVLLGVLAGAAVAVFYLLPRYAPQTLPIDFAAISRATKNLAPGLPSGLTDATAATDANSASDAKLQATRENFEHRLAALEARGAGVWGGPEFATAKMRAAESVGAHDAGNTRMAEERLADASHLLDQVDSRAPQVLAAQLAIGQKALASGQEEVANQAFDLARRIDPNDRRIADGQRRSRNLPGVLPLLADGQNAETGRNYPRAAQDYSQALSLDPGNEKARAGLARANAAFGDDNYAKSVGSGFAALGAGRLDDARDAFERARALRPTGSEAADGLRRVGASLSAKGFTLLRQRAAGLEAQERWDEAVEAYNSALQADPSLLFAQEGKNRAAERAELGASMQALIDRPERLAGQSVREQARALLQTANQQSPSGPVLRSQIARLGLLMPEDFDKPVRLSLVSDNATAVAIPSIGQFGTFGKHDIELKPGRYTIIGTRNGFREVRRDITIAPGQENQTISVSCSDPI